MGKIILVVDDSKTIRQSLKTILEKEGFTIVEAGDGLEGIDVLNKTKDVSLVIADINMPNMDGLTMVEKIKTDGKHPTIPIVMLTTEGGAEAIARAKAAGVKGWLIKPCKPEQLMLTAKKLTTPAAA